MGCGDEKLSKYLTQTFTAHRNAMICQQVTLSGDAEWPKVADAVIEATLSMRKLLMAFSSERGLQSCRVRLWTGRDGEPEGAQQRSGVLAAAHARNRGRGRRGAGWRRYGVGRRR